MFKIGLFFMCIIGLLLINACSENETPQKEQTTLQQETQRGFTVPAEADSTASGLQYVIQRVGEGEQASAGQKVAVHYTGWLMNGKKFDSSHDRGKPIEFLLGQGNVIPGWDEGIAMMKVGGKRRLFIPPQLGYGEKGYPGVIPGNAMLVFDVELIGVK